MSLPLSIPISCCAAAVALLFLSPAQSPAAVAPQVGSSQSTPALTIPGRQLKIAGIPVPRDMVQVKEGVPYTVPQGKVLVVTALGAVDSWPGGNATLFVNGIAELAVNQSALFGDVPMRELPVGFTVSAGKVAEAIDSGAATAEAWGYLAAAPSNKSAIEGVPAETAMVQVREGTPYVVPQGRVLVVSGVGAAKASISLSLDTALLKVDGQSRFTTRIGPISIVPVPSGLAIGSGHTVTVESAGQVVGAGNGRVWGWLGYE